MANTKKITSFTNHNVAGANRISATYSEISEEGKTIKNNSRFNMIVTDEEVQAHIDAIEEFLQEKISE